MSCVTTEGGNTRDIDLGQFATGSVDRIRVTITKDGEEWVLSSATVTYTFTSPSGTSFDRAATVEDAAGGIAYYDTTTTDLDESGYWRLEVTVVDGAVTKRYPYEISLYVSDE